MSKHLKLADPLSSAGAVQFSQTNWMLCIICQEDKADPLTCPSKSKHHDVGSGFGSLAENLANFNELGILGTHKHVIN